MENQDLKTNDSLNEAYEMSSSLFRFYQATHAYQGIIRDYAQNGVTLGQSEAHLLTDISDNPGMTTTQLSTKWHKTTAAISQMITKLEGKGMVERRSHPDNALNILIYPTEFGVFMSGAHKQYDENSVHSTLEYMKQKCTDTEIRAFFKVLEVYIDIVYKKMGK